MSVASVISSTPGGSRQLYIWRLNRMAKKKKVTQDHWYHNTLLLLKKYRDVVWSLTVAVEQVKNKGDIYMKKSLMLIVALMTMVLLVGCNNNEEVINNNNEDENVVNQGQNEIIINNDEDEIPEELASTKTLAFFQKFVSGGSYTMEMSTEYEGVKTTAINAYDGDDIYTESEYQ